MAMFLFFFALSFLQFTQADYTTTIDPTQTWGTWQGWGTSLAWWANVFGDRDDLADAVFSMNLEVSVNNATLPGLGMNIARYNAGASSSVQIGSEKMVSSPSCPSWKHIEGFWLNWDSANASSPSWDWNRDANQVAMLQKAKKRAGSTFVAELFSNSPMWWMCLNHNPSGSATGSENNLQSWNYNQHAVYLAVIAAEAHLRWDITFDSVEAFNEPASDWWIATGTQEGCHFDPPTQALVAGYLRKEMDDRNLGFIKVAASDENTYDLALSTWQSFNSSEKANVQQVNTHGYQYTGGRRDLLYAAAHSDGKVLWNSEYGEGDASGMRLAQNLNLDFQWLHPTAWVYWQVLDGGGWGLLQVNENNLQIGPVNPKWFVLAQYSRHIRPGFTIISSGSDRNTVSAYSNTENMLIIVTTNYGTAQWVTYDLSAFQTVPQGNISSWCTNTAGPNQYLKQGDTVVDNKVFWSWFATNTIQTFELPGVYL